MALQALKLLSFTLKYWLGDYRHHRKTADEKVQAVIEMMSVEAKGSQRRLSMRFLEARHTAAASSKSFWIPCGNAA